jgi:pyruvate dehydrogenase E2 component (dihydrolipoamide acetyltransferase)
MIIKAASASLIKVPKANASWENENTKYYKNTDISVAVAIDGGLITPIVRNVQSKGLFDISSDMKYLSSKAKEGKLLPHEYTGGSFSISNLGMFGIKQFLAVINPPQGAILAVGAGEKKAVVINENISIATVMSVTLSCDHRVIDGAVGAEFLSVFKEYIENPSLMLL